VTEVPAWFSEIDPSLFKTAAREGAPPAEPRAGVAPAPVPPEAVPPPAPAPEKEGVPATGGQTPKVM